MDTFLFLIACAGMTFTIVHAEIMDILHIRPLLDKWSFTRKLTHCSLCTGTWVGALLGPFAVELRFVIPFLFASAAVSFLFERLMILIDESVLKLENEKKEKEADESID